MGHSLCEKAALTLDDTWRLWAAEKRQAFATIALAHVSWLAQCGICCGPIVPWNNMASNEAVMDRKHLRQLLTECFDEEDLRTLCFDLRVDYDSLRGEGKAARARELVLYLEKRGRIPELVQTCFEMRPSVSWRSPSSISSEVPNSFQPVSQDSLLRGLGMELRSLDRQGFVQQNANVLGGWQVRPAVFLWWLVDKAGWLDGGAATLIDAAARGAGADVVAGG